MSRNGLVGPRSLQAIGLPVMDGVLVHGVDLAPVDRVEQLVERHGERFLSRVFTAGEQADVATSRRRRSERLAARFAAKEAVLKALGTGWSGGIAWTDVEVVTDPSGAPRVRLHGKAAERATGLGVVRWAVSLSHAGGMAVASVVGTGSCEGQPSL